MYLLYKSILYKKNSYLLYRKTENNWYLVLYLQDNKNCLDNIFYLYWLIKIYSKI